MSNYISADSPRGNGAAQFQQNVKDTSSAIQEFQQTTRLIQQKMGNFGTPQDSRANHQQLKELTEKGNRLVVRINRKLEDLYKACQGPSGRTNKTLVNKLSGDHKNQLQAFEKVCKELIEREKSAMANIRQSSHSFRSDDGDKHAPKDYHEDQIYTKASIQSYNEDDMARREEDLVHINHQMREVNSAFAEVNKMIQDQGEVVVEIQDNTEAVEEAVSGGLREVREADMKRGWCQCTKTKMLCWGALFLIALIVVLSIVLAVK